MLVRAFKTLISQKEVSSKICFLIDGLDEYDGDYGEIVELFRQTTISANVKICVSSRPEVEFTNAYASSGIPSLALHDLTRNDIRRYIDDKLGNHPRIKELTMREPIYTRELVSEIVDTANGVFLWVTLTVASLVKGLLRHDQFPDLQARLRALPPTLETLFDQMVLRVDDVYKEHASKLYQLVAATQIDPPGWRQLETRPLTVLEVYFAQEDSRSLGSIANTGPLSEEEMISKCEDVDIWLKSWCGGLLEISHRGSLGPDMPVTYLHRTVRDYLVKRNTKLVLQGRVAPGFAPTLSIFRAIVLRISTSGYYQSRYDDTFRRALLFARRAEEDTATSQVALLDKLCE